MENTIIIGSGPAGLTAAIYTARALLNPLMIEGYLSGGQLMNTTEVENFPGFPKGVMGPELMAQFKEQAIRFGTRIESKDVSKVDFSKKPYSVFVGDKVYQTHTVIIATGAKSKLLGFEGESQLMGKGVSTCATCDGAFFRNQEIAVVGGGDSAMEEAIFLTRFASKVTLIHRREQLRASQIMQERARKNPKIQWRLNCVVQKALGSNGLETIEIKNIQTNNIETMSVTGLFVAIGHEPNTQLFKDQIVLDENGYIKTTHGTKTNVAGVFACGDVQDHVYRQAITAAGSGCMAALDAERYLAGH